MLVACSSIDWLQNDLENDSVSVSGALCLRADFDAHWMTLTLTPCRETWVLFRELSYNT